ncbi:MAG TPA: polyprenyl synthetase family protein [Candidatus Eremiobacteraceae bacterium]|nr:polyprenyl synthetase family protein [Candidatus Eremiobacteraceae bacterium]
MIDSSAAVSIQSVVEEFVREELSQENAHIAGAVWSMLDAGGKRLRPRITMLAGRACDPAAVDDPVLASYMELIHIATLIHDDVLDDADTRRGRASTNRAFGNRFSVLAGDYLFSWVFKKVTQNYPNPIPTILAAMLAEICNGEVKQLRAAGNAELPVEAYLEIIGKKTAELFAACAECGAIVATHRRNGSQGPALRELPAVKALRAFGWSFGMAFQIRDDLLDITAAQETIGKPAGSDLREKKVTLPLLYALDDRESGSRVRHAVDELFALDDASVPEAAGRMDAVVSLVRGSTAVRRAATEMAQWARRAESALGAVAASPARDELAALAQTLTEFSP